MPRLDRLAAEFVVVLAAATLAGCGGSGSKQEQPVAVVAGQAISREHLDQTVEHFQEEARKEGRMFPAKGSRQYGSVEKRLLALLVYRKEIEIAAARIGVHVTGKQVEAQLEHAGGEAHAAKPEEETFLRDTARFQLLTEAVTRRLTKGVHVENAEVRSYYRTNHAIYGKTPFARVRGAIVSQLLASRRNAVLARWLAQAQRSLGPKVRYELKS
jgi:hypothetical protein